MTIFDRYLIRKYLHVFVIGFISMFGLYVVMDGFTNVDHFQALCPGEGPAMVLKLMARHYMYQSLDFFGLIGPILIVISTMVVFAMLQKHCEIFPILSAGIPTYRLMFPILSISAVMLLLLTLNQELLIPRIVHRLEKPQDSRRDGVRNATPVTDPTTNILITAEELNLAENCLHLAQFVLPMPDVVEETTMLKANRAIRLQANDSHPAGWKLIDTQPTWNELYLSTEGRRIVHPLEKPGELFVVSGIELDQFYDQKTNLRLLATGEVIERLKIPASTKNAFTQLALTLHKRLTAWMVTLLAVSITIPLIVRKEKMSLVGNLATCVAMLAVVLAIAEGSYYLGQAHLLTLDLAVWLPVILCGGITAMLSTQVQT